MSFFDCLADAMDEGSADRVRGERAQAKWNDQRDLYRRQGYTDEMADALAADDVKAAFRKEAGDERHRFLAQVSTLRRIEASVMNANDTGTLATNKVEYMAGGVNNTTSIVGQTNSLRRLFHYRMAELIQKHYRNLLGNNKDMAGLMNIARELHGESTGDLAALAVANGVRDAMAEMRRMFNEAGGTIGVLDDFGIPHIHDKLAVTRAGFDTWFEKVRHSIAWDRIEDFTTGKPFAAKGSEPHIDIQRRFLKEEVFDNIAFGEGSKEAVYGKPQGQNIVKQHGQARTLHFKSANDWIAYNKEFGSGDIYGSIIAHAHRMSEDIVVLRELGPSPELGLQYQEQVAIKRARDQGDVELADRIRGNHEHARRMLRIQRGGTQATTLRQAAIARFFSSARHIISGALLDRAVIASISDTNTMRMAANSVGMNQFSPLRRQMDLLFSGSSRQQLARAGWIADTMTDPGLVLSRWQSEVPPADIAERISSSVMRAQGLAHWTDQSRIAFQFELSGHFADFAGRKVSDIDDPLRSLLQAKGVTDEDWAAFTNPAHMYNPAPDAQFASPMWWRENTDLAPEKADEIFLKMQSLIEEQTELAVPTQSLYARAFVEGDLVPGTFGYEIAKSGLMVKSFAMTFTTNQISRIMATKSYTNYGVTLTGNAARAFYAADLLAGATIMGAIALQVGELAYGRDPKDMTTPDFWAQATMKGGGFGVIGDVIAAGETSWGGGFQSYVAGPGIQALGDTWNLSVGNAVDLMSGKDTDFGRDLVKYLDRYTPGADIPVVGLAIDRLFWNSLQGLLDPEAEKALSQAESRRVTRSGNQSFWSPGSAAPSRAPNVGAAFGG